jgi:DNA-binding SARP family transcriptional activator
MGKSTDWTFITVNNRLLFEKEMTEKLPSLKIRLFGIPQIALNGHGLEGLRRKNRGLIYYLAAQDHHVARETILTFFWPDHERAAALPILRTMIYDLRKYLGASFYADDAIVSLSPEASIDLREFSKALQSPPTDLILMTNTLNLYRGDFLEGFSLSNSPQYNDWVDGERERYRLIAMNGFTRLAHLYEQQRNYPLALDWMRHALKFNNLQEDLQRDMMRLLYLTGDRAGVIRHYDALRKLLDEEMGVPPMPETRDLYNSIIKDTFIPRSVEAKSQHFPVIRPIEKPLLPFLGRDTELEMLKQQLNSSKLIILEGEPGIGKTSLATELITSQTQGKSSILILQAKSYELEKNLPYLPITAALRKLLAQPEWDSIFMQMNLESIWLTEVSRLLPELLTRFPNIPAPIAPAEEPRLWEALLQLFQSLSRKWEVWFFLDDLQWADASTIAWLGYLIHNISSSPLVLLSTVRPNEQQPYLIKLLQSLKREDRLMQIQLSALPELVMQKMAVILSARHNEQLSVWLIRNSEGNPYFIIELLRYAYRVGMLKNDGTLDTELMESTPAIPPTIQNLIESRMLKLSENARMILHISAIIGQELDYELMRQVSPLSELDTLNSIEELQTAHLLIPLAEEKFAFDHHLTLQAAIDDMNETRRHFFHRLVAEKLESIFQNDLDPVSGLIYYHFINGNMPKRANTYAFRAGRFAANLAAWVEAIAFYRQALSLESEEIERLKIYLVMGFAHFHKGDFASASIDYRSAIELAQAKQEWSLLEEAYLGLSLSLYPQARFAEVNATAKQLLQSGPPELAICAEFIWGASLNVESAHPFEAERHLRNAEQLMKEQQGTFVSKVSPTEIKYSLAGTYGQQGRNQDAIRQFRDVSDMLERGEGTLDTLRNIMLYNNLAYYLHLIGDISAIAYVEKGIKLARERGSLSHLPYLYSTLGEIYLANGDLDTAERYFTEGLHLAEQIIIPERIAGMTANLGLVAKKRGNTELASDRLKQALKLVQPLGNYHLEVRIRIWLAPLLPLTDARSCLNSAHVLAEQGGLQGLLKEIVELENRLS